MLDALLLRKLPVPAAGDLSFVQGPQATQVSLTFPQYRDLRERNRSFTEMGAYDLLPVGVTVHGQTLQQLATLATGTYFDLLQIKPYMGRFPTAADDARGVNASPFVVLTYDSWRHDYDSDPGVIGRRITISKSPFTIIGVAPPGFYGTERFVQPPMWIDLWSAPQLGMGGQMDSRSSAWVFVIGRRKAAITRDAAAADLNRVAHELAREYPQTDEKDQFVLAEPGYIGNMMGPALHAFLGGVLLLAALVLLAACANLGSLYAARAADRRRDIAIRMALGATRARVTIELMVESVLLGLVGGALGCLLARVVLHALTSYRPPFEFPIAVVVEPHGAVYGFAFVLAAIAGLLCGIVPAREVRRTELQEVMKSGAIGAGERGRRWTARDALLLVEVTLCCVLVMASVVSLRGLAASRRMAFGFDPNGVVMVAYNLSIAGYKDDDAERFSRKLAEDAAALPGVESAAFASNTPLNTGNDTDWIYPAGTTDLRPSNRLFSSLDYDVSPGLPADSTDDNARGSRLQLG